MRRRPLIHVVDDHHAVRRSVAFLVQTAGFTVETWASGDAFLQAIGADEHACVILDIRMPPPDGIAVRLEMARRGIAMPTIMITSHLERDVLQDALSAGACDVIAKPFGRDVLLAAIDAAVQFLDVPGELERRAAKAARLLATLTEYDRAILNAMVAGLGKSDIAAAQRLSPHMVELRWVSILKQLGMRGLPEVVRLAHVAAAMPVGLTDTIHRPDAREDIDRLK